jgi:hypothetical protein
MIGDERRDAEAPRARDAFDAGDAVVHGDDEIRLSLRGELDQLRRKAVAEPEAVGHEVIHLRAERAQGPQAHRARGRAVGVVVGHDEHAPAGLDRVGEQPPRLRYIPE